LKGKRGGGIQPPPQGSSTLENDQTIGAEIK
jgi:hypothetical protein